MRIDIDPAKLPQDIRDAIGAGQTPGGVVLDIGPEGAVTLEAGGGRWTGTLRDDEQPAEEDDRLDAARFRALMRCPRIKMQGSAGIDPRTGDRKYPDQPGMVHFGAEFWPSGTPHESGQDDPAWGRHALRALADDILAVEGRDAGTRGDRR